MALSMTHLYKISFLSAVFLLLSGFSFWQWQKTEAQTKPLTYPEIITALNSRLPNGAFKTRAQVIDFLIAQIQKRKVDKPLTSDREDDLRQAGATQPLIEAIRSNSPNLSTPTPTPVPVLTPTRTPTPTPTLPPPPSETAKQIKNSIGMEFVLIPSGSFLMGSTNGEKDRDKNESPQHPVTIRYNFYMGKYEVTQAQWKAVTGSLPEGMSDAEPGFIGDNLPVVRISWNDAKAFIAKLNAKNDGYTYRLPSEAEWEYAARAGTKTRFYWGDDLNFSSLCRYANVEDLDKCPDNFRQTAPVGTYLPNNFGLYDMGGNVWEWCEDIWQNDYNNLPADGSPNLTRGDADYHVLRGGSWHGNPWYARSAYRNKDPLTRRILNNGLRLAVNVK